MKLKLTLLFCLVGLLGTAQTINTIKIVKNDTITISLRTVDEFSQPLPFASIAVVDSGKTILNTNTDVNGNAEVKLSSKTINDSTLTIRCTYVGHYTIKLVNVPLVDCGFTFTLRETVTSFTGIQIIDFEIVQSEK